MIDAQKILNDTLKDLGSQSYAMWIEHCDLKYNREDIVIKIINILNDEKR